MPGRDRMTQGVAVIRADDDRGARDKLELAPPLCASPSEWFKTLPTDSISGIQLRTRSVIPVR